MQPESWVCRLYVCLCVISRRGYVVCFLALFVCQCGTVQRQLDGAHAQCREGYLQVVPPLQEEPALVAQDLRAGGHRARVQACQEGPDPLAGE